LAVSLVLEKISNRGVQLPATPTTNSRPLLLVICYLGFVSLGLPDTLIGVAWPSIRTTFQLKQGEVAWIFFGGGCSYLLSSFFAGRLLKIFNIGILLAASSGLVAVAAFDFFAARIWALFALGSILHGLGSGAIDTGLNHYVAHHFSARHMNWLHASYSVGAMLGPVLMTWAITRQDSFRLGYLLVAMALLWLAILFLITSSLWNNSATENIPGTESNPPLKNVSPAVAIRHPFVWMHVFLFFVYTGLEVAVGQWSFTVLTESRGLEPKTAGFWVTLYWAAILAGRVLFGFIVDRFGIDLLIRLSALVAATGTALFAWNPFQYSAPIALFLCGFGLAVIFPSLMTRTPQRLGQAIAVHAIGWQVGAAMLGAAALPSLTGLIAQTASVALVPATLLAFALMLLLTHELLLRMDQKAQKKSLV
jgi:fucose permease